ncbi:MAG: hypothetical protein ABSB42_06120 [Tepidisphaeraceae bacterium]
MASTSQTSLRLPALNKRNMAQLVAKAKRMGVPPEHYAKRLVEDGLAFQREAEESTFAEIMGPVRQAAGKVDDAEIVKLVDKTRSIHHGSNGRGKMR